jgi:methyl-accepting chemotaxis protein
MAAKAPPEARLRVPLFVKFLIGNLALAALLITGGYLVVRSQAKLKDRGNYLDKHYKRFLGYMDGLSRALASTTEVVAADEDLVEALSAKQPNAPAPADAAHAPMTGNEIGNHLWAALNNPNGLKPDIMFIFTADGQLVWAPDKSSISPDDIGKMSAVALVRNNVNSAFSDKILIDDKNVWLAVGIPVVSNNKLLGGVIAGIDINRYMKDFKEQSDDNEATQYRLSLLVDGRVVASVFDQAVWPELERQIKEDRRVLVRRGDDERYVIRLKSGDYDFTGGPVDGFVGLTQGNIGELYLMRSRVDLDSQELGIPWKEIIIGIVLSVIFALGLATWVSRPIKQFVEQSRQLLEGETDLTHRVAVSSRDETADLAENINQVFGRLHDLAAGVQSAAFQVGASSAEISAASKQMLAGLKDQTMKIEGSTAAVTELSASIQQVAANAAQATDVAEKSNVAVTAAVTRMQQIRAAVEDAAEKMKELGESSKRIGNIVEVIRQISEQTSLLALNASIEAAHAGEQGRGFAVVADEVSSLARRVGQSAKDIEALIQTIKEQTAAAISSMDVGTREVEGGAQLVTHTLTDLGELISVVKDTASAVQEQAVVSDEIARNMDAVQKIAGEVLSGSEESVVQAEQLHELAFQLEQSIGGFNLDGSGAADQKRGGNGRTTPSDIERARAKALPKRAGEDRSAG